MKNKIKIISLLSIAVLAATGSAFASYYKGDKYHATTETPGLLAGGGIRCLVKKGEVAKVIAPLTRYNILVVMTPGLCLSLVGLGGSR